MNKLSLNIIFAITLLTCTGCTSTFISDSLAIIEREQSQTVNKSVLKSIQALRASQKTAEHTYTSTKSSTDTLAKTFTYELNNKELSGSNKIKLAQFLIQKQHHIIINIAPAKAESQLAQISLAMKRASILRQYVARFNIAVTIMFAPELSTDTIRLSIGA